MTLWVKAQTAPMTTLCSSSKSNLKSRRMPGSAGAAVLLLSRFAEAGWGCQIKMLGRGAPSTIHLSLIEVAGGTARRGVVTWSGDPVS